MKGGYDVGGYGWEVGYGGRGVRECWEGYGLVWNKEWMVGDVMEWLFGGVGGMGEKEM